MRRRRSSKGMNGSPATAPHVNNEAVVAKQTDRGERPLRGAAPTGLEIGLVVVFVRKPRIRLDDWIYAYGHGCTGWLFSARLESPRTMANSLGSASAKS